MMEISPEKWKEASIHGIKLSQTVIERSDTGMKYGKRADPLPLLRDACIEQTNDRTRTYTRATRAVVAKLQKSYVAVNEEMKSLNRSKESVEKAIEHKRKDIALNQDSKSIRAYRPPREKEEDCADKLLNSEASHLLSLKRSLEAQLRKVKLHLSELSSIRAHLAAAIQERSRVTDLLCQSLSSSIAASGNTPRDLKRPKSSVSLRKPTPLYSPSSLGSTCSSRSEAMGSGLSMRSHGSHFKAYSAPVPLELGIKHPDEEDRSGNVVNMMDIIAHTPDPYDPLSAEAAQSMNMASEAIQTSRTIRQEVASVIDHTQRLQQAAHESVNEGITRKLAQTITLTEHLGVSSGETKAALRRSQRHFNAQEKALGYLLGPISAEDITTRESLERPIVKVYQRHVGTDLPEAAHLIRATEDYKDSLDKTMKNITLLRLADRGLRGDIKDKKTAAFLDSSLVRLRRRKANHRWVLHGKGYKKPGVV